MKFRKIVTKVDRNSISAKWKRQAKVKAQPPSIKDIEMSRNFNMRIKI